MFFGKGGGCSSVTYQNLVIHPHCASYESDGYNKSSSAKHKFSQNPVWCTTAYLLVFVYFRYDT